MIKSSKIGWWAMPRKKPVLGRLEIVYWSDACTVHGWQDAPPEGYEPSRCKSVGWLIQDDKVAVALAPNTHEEQVGDVMVIPKTWIIKRVVLKSKI